MTPQNEHNALLKSEMHQKQTGSTPPTSYSHIQIQMNKGGL